MDETAIPEFRVDSQHLIDEIRKRPLLWDNATKDYCDKHARKTAWDEILDIFGPDLDTEQERTHLNIQLQRKWKNMRDCYFREFRRIQDVKKGKAVPKRTRYVHFEQLKFLNAIIESKTTNCEESQKRSLPSSPVTAKRSKPNDESIAAELLHILKKSVKLREDVEEDGDRYFFLSLVPEFKKVPSYLRNKIKLKILSFIERYIPTDVQPSDAKSLEIRPSSSKEVEPQIVVKQECLEELDEEIDIKDEYLPVDFEDDSNSEAETSEGGKFECDD